MFGGWVELLVILGIFLLLFGATKIPQLMKGAGQGVSEFSRELKKGQKKEDNGLEKDEDEKNR